MYWQEMRTPSLPGENDVTNGSVENFPPDAPVPEELPEKAPTQGNTA